MSVAQLSWNTPGEFEHNGIYDNKDPKVTEESWAKLNYDLGSIALSDEYADSVGLPRAQRFPWDQSKGLYFLNGYHGIHCLVRVTRSHLPFWLLTIATENLASHAERALRRQEHNNLPRRPLRSLPGGFIAGCSLLRGRYASIHSRRSSRPPRRRPTARLP